MDNGSEAVRDREHGVTVEWCSSHCQLCSGLVVIAALEHI